MLRQYYDSISTTLDCLDQFMSENQDLYDQQDDFEDRCGCYKTILSYQIIHLARLRRRFLERMQRFESMRDSLLAASMLRENRQFNRQSQDIELLTKVTVTYLPFSLAAAILGMSETIPKKSIWCFWLLLAVALVVMTFYPAIKHAAATLRVSRSLVDRRRRQENSTLEQFEDWPLQESSRLGSRKTRIAQSFT